MKIEVSVETNKVRSKCTAEFEVEDDDWNTMSDDEKDELCREHMFAMIDWDYQIKE